MTLMNPLVTVANELKEQNSANKGPEICSIGIIVDLYRFFDTYICFG